MRAVEYLFEKYAKDIKQIAEPAAVRPPRTFQHQRRHLMTQEEHDKILALWRSGEVTRPQLEERFNRSHATIWQITVGKHRFSHAHNKQTPHAA